MVFGQTRAAILAQLQIGARAAGITVNRGAGVGQGFAISTEAVGIGIGEAKYALAFAAVGIIAGIAGSIGLHHFEINVSIFLGEHAAGFGHTAGVRQVRLQGVR